MRVGKMGAEILRNKEGSFQTQLPESEGGDKYHLLYSGWTNVRSGVGEILKEEVIKFLMMYELISDRIMIMRLNVAPINVLILQIYAPCENETEEEKLVSIRDWIKSQSSIEKGDSA